MSKVVYFEKFSKTQHFPNLFSIFLNYVFYFLYNKQKILQDQIFPNLPQNLNKIYKNITQNMISKYDFTQLQQIALRGQKCP